MSQPSNENLFPCGLGVGPPTLAPVSEPCARAAVFKAHELQDGTETILFVEDEEFVQRVTAEVLRSAGYKALTAQGAAEALQRYDQHPGGVDLLLTDVILSDGNGRALAQQLRRKNPGIRVLFVSGYAEQMKLCEAGSDAGQCLPKPFSAGILLRVIRQVLAGNELQAGRCRSTHALFR